MYRRLLRPLVYTLVAMQLMLVVPVASAWAAEGAVEVSAAQAMPCDDMSTQVREQHPKHCPCCPDGATEMTNCQTACAAGVAVISAAHYFASSPVAVPAMDPLPVIFHPLADPPLKPPPIA